jgi:hypothetical protein
MKKTLQQGREARIRRASWRSLILTDQGEQNCQEERRRVEEIDSHTYQGEQGGTKKVPRTVETIQD